MLSGIGSRVTVRFVIASTAVFGALRNTCGPNVAPPSMLVAKYRATRALDASLRASYHVATTVPLALSTAIAGENWDRSPSVTLSAAESSLTWVADQSKFFAAVFHSPLYSWTS